MELIYFTSCFVRQNQQKKITFFARRFQTTSKQTCSNLRPLLSITFPQGFRISKNIGHPTSESGGKQTFKWYLKSEQTDRRTDRQTDGHFDLQKVSAQRADALKIFKASFLMRAIKSIAVATHLFRGFIPNIRKSLTRGTTDSIKVHVSLAYHYLYWC